MRIRESGMPEDVAYWESLFDPVQFLHVMGFDMGLGTIADFGCGYGTFTLPLARCARGQVYAIDLEPAMLEILQKRATQERISNIITLRQDLLAEGCGLTEESLDGILLAHLLHGESKENVRLLREAHRVLRIGGRAAVIHWRRDVPTPRGPTLSFRPTPEQCSDWCIQAGFSKDSQEKYALGLYHWGIVMRK